MLFTVEPHQLQERAEGPPAPQHPPAAQQSEPGLLSSCSPFCRVYPWVLTFGAQQRDGGCLERGCASHQVPAPGLSHQAWQWGETLSQSLPEPALARARLPTALLPRWLCRRRSCVGAGTFPPFPCRVFHCGSCAVCRRRFCFLFFCNSSSARFKFNFLLFNKRFFGSAFSALQLF